MSQPHQALTRRSTASIPRWVKLFGIIFIVLSLLFAVLHLTGNSLGGPAMHMPSTEQGMQHP